ncbi:NAD-dependent protein deacylase [Paenibacillus flagellatus]|uniref:NAD-dependent protein deacetylase n=1 Tax=Paenibacillus flagellatus TaxID=2211139 RepID=A0A2V5KZE6_9BACL|nr:NAD-dependent protein deacylase [Paenibacillus flagellatus]PYI55486.1 NAD-dependent protein deacylase [Paenibacillus flagellatus]
MDFDTLRRIIGDSPNIVFFGGAGTSTESGIPDFRSNAGLFRTMAGSEHPPEEMLSRTFFDNHPAEFYRFYKTHMLHPGAKPNAGHLALAELEAQGRLKALVTQNIDGLHQAAGSRNVLELHGSVHRNGCMACGAFYTLDELLALEGPVPRCVRCQGIVKPDVVLYEEPLDDDVFAKAAQAIAEADVLIVAGTSLSVYPAAGLLRHYGGDRLLLINKSPTKYDGYARYIIPDSFALVMDRLVR